MVEMTVLHFASPFSVSAAVPPSQTSPSTKDDGGERQSDKRNGTADRDAPGSLARSGSPLDARDIRSTVMRATELAPPTSLGDVPVTVEAVLAAYRQDGAAEQDDDPPAA